MSGLTLDTGALIAFERGDRKVVAIIAEAIHARSVLAVPSTVIAQAWRDGRKQARLARLLGSPAVEVEVFDGARARATGQLCGVRGTSDIVDASVVLCARARGHGVLSSDLTDLQRLDPTLRLVPV